MHRGSIFRRAATLAIPSGVVLYRGPSCLDPTVTIVVVATGLDGGSQNRKTGGMVQTWILRDDVPPHVASGPSGLDAAICGDCPHRHNPETGHRTCYVATHQAPLAVYRSRDRYPMADDRVRAWLRSATVRIGSYGDPAAVPVGVWQSIAGPRRTGYTHQWRQDHAQALKSLIMASVDSVSEAMQARAMGWRTFRVAPGTWGSSHRKETAIDTHAEITCVSESRGVPCVDCRMCDGSNAKPSIVIDAHGASKSHLRIIQ